MSAARPFLRPLAAVLALVIVLAAGCGSVKAWAAKVDGDTITQKELVEEMRAIATNEQYLRLVSQQQPVKGAGQATFDSSFTALTLTREIYFRLIDKELARRKLVVRKSDDEIARPAVIQRVQGEEIYRDFPKDYQAKLVRQTAKLNVLTLALGGGGKSVDDAARAYYDANPNDFARAQASHILVDSKEKAEQARARIAAGADFGAVAKEVSTDDSSKARNGELGVTITRQTRFSGEMLAQIFALPVGDVSQPVQTQFGFHLIKVTAREVPPYDQVADQARQLALASGEDKFSNWLEEAIKKAKIEVNPRYGTFSTEGDAPGVVPPAAPSTTVPPGAAPAPTQP